MCCVDQRVIKVDQYKRKHSLPLTIEGHREVVLAGPIAGGEGFQSRGWSIAWA